MAAFLQPLNLSMALEALAKAPMTVLAGGTDFYPARVGRAITEDVLDISAIEELRGIVDAGDHWRIGATTTWTDVIEADLPDWLRSLRLAAREVGGVQIQNAGTIAGNLCNASPAADGIPPLLAFDAEVELASAEGTCLLPLAEFVQGNRRTACRPGQLVTALRIAKPRHPARSDFLKLGTRRYLVISIVMVAGTLEVDADGTVAAARLAVGACSARAQRLPRLEARLVGRPAHGRLGDCVEAADLASLTPIDDARGTADYRLDAAATLVRRLLSALGEGR